MVSSSPSPPASADVLYSKIGAASSFWSLEYSSAAAGHERVQASKSRAFVACTGSICLSVVILTVVLRHGHGRQKGSPKPASATPPSIAPVQPLPLSSLCNMTDHGDLCFRTLTSFPLTHSIAPLQDLTAFVAKTARACLNETYLLAMNLSRIGRGSSGEKAVLQDCLELLDQAGDGLRDSIDQLSKLNLHEDFKAVQGQVMNVRVWMSSSYTEQDTCWDEFQDLDGSVKDQLLKSGRPIAPLISIAMSFANVLQQVGLSTMYAVHSFPP